MVGFATDTLRASGGGHGFAGGAVEQGAVRGRRPGKSQRGTIAVRELLANRVATSEAGKTTRRRGRGRRTAAGDAACAGHVTRKKTGAARVAGREAWVKAGAAAEAGARAVGRSKAVAAVAVAAAKAGARAIGRRGDVAVARAKAGAAAGAGGVRGRRGDVAGGQRGLLRAQTL